MVVLKNVLLKVSFFILAHKKDAWLGKKTRIPILALTTNRSNMELKLTKSKQNKMNIPRRRLTPSQPRAFSCESRVILAGCLSFPRGHSWHATHLRPRRGRPSALFLLSGAGKQRHKSVTPSAQLLQTEPAVYMTCNMQGLFFLFYFIFKS